MSLIVTGFGPFPGMDVNPTEAMVMALAAAYPHGVEAVILPTEWRTAERMGGLVTRARIVLMLGVSNRARRMRYERLAWPEVRPLPDARGALPDKAPPISRRTALPVFALARNARRSGYTADISSDPGRYICNAAYAAALAANPRTLFVHVPVPGYGGLTPYVEHAAFLLERLARL